MFISFIQIQKTNKGFSHSAHKEEIFFVVVGWKYTKALSWRNNLEISLSSVLSSSIMNEQLEIGLA